MLHLSPNLHPQNCVLHNTILLNCCQIHRCETILTQVSQSTHDPAGRDSRYLPGYPCAFSKSISHNILRIMHFPSAPLGTPPLGISTICYVTLRSLRLLSAAQYIAPLTSTPLSAAQCSAVRRLSTVEVWLNDFTIEHFQYVLDYRFILDIILQ